MTEPYVLETPASAEDLYLARVPEVVDFAARPIFTGDVLRLADERVVCAVQHPCAMRRGLELLPKILACAVAPFVGGVPRDWSTGHFRRMFLPELNEDGNFAIEFPDFEVITPAEIENAARLAILSAYGVNLLVQRWTYQNNRVVIPTRTINVQTAGPFEEADLVEEVCGELIAAGTARAVAERRVDDWLGEGTAGGPPRRDRLNDPQARSTVRRELRSQLDGWLEEPAGPAA